jgi:hypothetical protein
MKHLKTFGLAIVTAMALTVFVGVGGAVAGPTELYIGHTTAGNANGTGGVATHWTLKSGTSATQSDTSGELADTCKASTIASTTGQTTASLVSGTITSLTWGECTFPTKTVTNGALDITYVGDKNGDGQGDGTVTGTASVVTTLTFGLFDCRYGTGAGTHLGTLSGSTAGPAALSINATINEVSPHVFGCPETTKWVANYSVTSPLGLNVRQ